MQKLEMLDKFLQSKVSMHGESQVPIVFLKGQLLTLVSSQFSSCPPPFAAVFFSSLFERYQCTYKNNCCCIISKATSML